VDFLDIVTRGGKGIEFRLEEFEVPKDSGIADHTIGELKIGERAGAITPADDDRIFAGDTLVVLGSRDQVDRLEKLMRGEKLSDESSRLLP
jgi:voltage-gated potassium channel